MGRVRLSSTHFKSGNRAVVPADCEDGRSADAEEVRQDGGGQKKRRGQQLITVLLK